MLVIEDHHQSGRGNRVFRLKEKHPGSGFRGGLLCICDSLVEVHEALNHYYREGPRVQDHANNCIEHCPLCRLLKSKSEKQGDQKERVTR